MPAILGIDAAWTSHNPSGIALIRETALEGWECVAVEDSYQAFLNRSGISFDCSALSCVPGAKLLEAAEIMAETEVNLIVADIPLARGPITGRRRADNEISSLFGGRGCSTHTPSSDRPGLISEEIRNEFQHAGYTLAVKDSGDFPPRALIETYPHPALLLLMNESYRVPYKISRARKYHPLRSPVDRRAAIYRKLQDIQIELSKSISGINIAFSPEVPTVKMLKAIEDKIDALVCSWVGIHVLQADANAIGDSDSAIWLPSKSLRPTDWSALLAPHVRASREFMKGVDELPLERRIFER